MKEIKRLVSKKRVNRVAYERSTHHHFNARIDKETMSQIRKDAVNESIRRGKTYHMNQIIIDILHNHYAKKECEQ